MTQTKMNLRKKTPCANLHPNASPAKSCGIVRMGHRKILLGVKVGLGDLSYLNAAHFYKV